MFVLMLLDDVSSQECGGGGHDLTHPAAPIERDNCYHCYSLIQPEE